LGYDKDFKGSFNRDEFDTIAIRLAFDDRTNVKTGSGLKRRRITGRGSPERDSESEEEEDDGDIKYKKKMYLNKGKFTINLEKLRRNILHVCYTNSRASIPALKRENITSDARDVLLDILANKYNDKLFNKLKSPDEQRLISTFVRTMKIPISMTEFDDSYQKNYEVLSGEVSAGNNNPKVKAELKLYILRGISEGLIPRHSGQLMLYNLSL
jgi:hypothetical protein